MNSTIDPLAKTFKSNLPYYCESNISEEPSDRINTHEEEANNLKKTGKFNITAREEIDPNSSLG